MSIDEISADIIKETRQKFKNRKAIFVVDYIGKDKKIHHIHGTVVSLDDFSVVIQYSLSSRTITIPLISIVNVAHMM